MVDREKWVADVKARLAVGEVRTHRSGSVAELVATFLPEIDAARGTGKTWKQIAADLSDGTALNVDVVRITFDRCLKAAAATPLCDASDKVGATGSDNVGAPASTEEVHALDLFAPMFDARDTRGRGQTKIAGQGSGE